MKEAECNGGIEISLLENYWWESKFSDKIYPCMRWGICLGGYVEN